MAVAVSPLALVAALVLCAAGVAKLHSPAAAWRALAAIGVGAPSWMVRLLAAAELALGTWFGAHPTPAGGVAIGSLYTLFAASSVLLARRHAACGCFGGDDAPASAFGVLLSAALAAAAIFSTLAGSHGAVWLLRHGGGYGAVVLAGSGACAYAMVLAYTRLPEAWRAWSPS